MNTKKNASGLTIIETLTASVIILFIGIIVFSTYVLLSDYISDTAKQAAVQSKIRLAMDKMGRDIRRASSISCQSSGNVMLLTLDPDRLGQAGGFWTSRYRLVGNQILFSPDISLLQEDIILNNVYPETGDKLFQYNGGRKLATVDLRVEQVSVDNRQDARLITIVKVRNAY